ncbi:unnamed protein product [Meloidogyne enterolobii]|uniref:Uncharacterized protein n=1 Tax=Meloidogyne enterolobii TaxID=390850 RepID=A0ACB0ZU00_MELEN
MNFLAKHFFDYQSVINLPHTAVQMHKMPPSQAGCDPSAAWAPKDLHVSGKNHAAPAARANRGYHGGDQRTGSHRHGRPSKLEFRNWGERHGGNERERGGGFKINLFNFRITFRKDNSPHSKFN